MGGGLVAVPDLAADGFVARHDRAHTLLEPLEVGGGEGFVAGEVVIETVFDDGADGHLDVGPELLRRLGEDMCGVVTQQIEAVGVARGHDLDARVVRDFARQVAQLAVHARGEGGARQAGPDIGGDPGRGHGRVVTARRAVRKGDDGAGGHGGSGTWASPPGLSTGATLSMSRRAGRTGYGGRR